MLASIGTGCGLRPQCPIGKAIPGPRAIERIIAMAKDAAWTNIDPNTLDQNHQQAYADYKEAYKMAKEAKAIFEEGMRKSADLPEGKLLVFGYNFGKLSLAIVEDDRKPKAASKPQGLAAFLASQAASGAAA